MDMQNLMGIGGVMCVYAMRMWDAVEIWDVLGGRMQWGCGM